MSGEVDVLEVRARIECRQWMMRKLFEVVSKRSPIDQMVDEATVREVHLYVELEGLLWDQADDLELIGCDATSERDLLLKLMSARTAAKGN